jgi:hypothetical protein
LGDPLLANAPFIGNNRYRFTQAFRRTLETTLALTAEQTWLPARERTIMVPLYLPLVALHLGEAVAGLDQFCEMRGTSREDVIAWPFRPAHWHNGYLYGTVLDFLNLPHWAGIPDSMASGTIIAGCARGAITPRWATTASPDRCVTLGVSKSPHASTVCNRSSSKAHSPPSTSAVASNHCSFGSNLPSADPGRCG